MRRELPTAELTALVAPVPLEEVLETLCQQGDLISFEIGTEFTCLEISKYAGLALLLKEACAPVENPRPYVANKPRKK